MTPDTAHAFELARRHGPAVAPAPLPDTEPPRPRPGMVPRASLVRRLIACRDEPIVVAAAPAGYGKTTLFAEWAMRDDRPFSWITLTPGAGDEQVGEVVGILREAAVSGRPQVIVVDDAHAVPAGAIGALLDAGARLPRGALLALATRRLPAAPTARLRAHRLVVELTARELSMTRLETAMLLDAAGLRLDAARVDRLLERTGGWPAALYLAALSLGGVSDIDAAIDRFDGADRLVADYIRSELLSGLSDQRRAFLRRSSILDVLSAPLCDAVLDGTGSAAIIEWLVRDGMPIEPLDRCDVRFRYHPLLAAMLRAELRRLEPALERPLQRRAADWLADDQPVAALGHAIAGRDPELAGRLLWSLAPGYAVSGRDEQLREWLACFPACQIITHAPLALAAAVCHLAQQRRIEATRAVESAERALEALPDAGEWPAAAALLRACIARDGVLQMAEDARRARELAPPGGAWESVGLLLGGVAHQLAGAAGPARAALEEAASRAGESTALVTVLCHAQLALLAADGANWDEADLHACAASAALPHVSGAVGALVLSVSAAVAAHRGEIARAGRDAAGAARLLAGVTDFAPWLLAEAHVWLARAEIQLSNGPTARMLLARAARLQTQVPDASVLARWVHDCWARADAFAASATGDGPALTNAELRVLRLLPSCLSFREIGQLLHVSPNTVKTQALAVYRKLDVSCRSEAVARGRIAGLIGG